MKTIEKKIKEAACKHADECCDRFAEDNSTWMNRKWNFIDGVKSNVAKEYHTQNLYTEEEVKEFIKNAYSYGYMDRDKDIGFGSNIPYSLEQLNR